MFVRRKTNKSGTISVQVVSKNRKKYKVERSFGTSRTESDIIRLEEQAKQYIRVQEGFVDTLFIDRDETSLKNFVASITNDGTVRDGCELLSKVYIFAFGNNTLTEGSKKYKVVNCFQKFISLHSETTSV